MSTPELDVVTKQRLAQEVEQLVRMGMDRKKARRIVWEDYQEEQAAFASETLPDPDPPQPEPRPPDTPVPEPPPVTGVVPKLAQAVPEARFFTPERLQKNRAELAKVKRLIGLRS
ncbi:hypothetical protein [Paludibacterium sp. B53371]|uniref:hypothetical protein n=1 Tax=Paludibacterium sp. B53371 TaxID=2806263 RepID=UPI001C05B0BC|nr:hypothetical protein [Paludibacterium sp. B53371]